MTEQEPEKPITLAPGDPGIIRISIQMVIYLFAIVGIVAFLSIGGYLIYNWGHYNGVSETQATQAEAVTAVPTPTPTPVPTAIPAPATVLVPTAPAYPYVATVIIKVAIPAQYGEFPELVDTAGKTYDISETGVDPSTINAGAEYELDVVSQRSAYGGIIYMVDWISPVNEYGYYYSGENDQYWNQPQNNIVYYDGRDTWYIHENDNYYHPVHTQDDVRGHEIVRGVPNGLRVRD